MKVGFTIRCDTGQMCLITVDGQYYDQQTASFLILTEILMLLQGEREVPSDLGGPSPAEGTGDKRLDSF